MPTRGSNEVKILFGGNNMNETVNQGQQQTSIQEPAQEKTFNQAELDKIVGERKVLSPVPARKDATIHRKDRQGLHRGHAPLGRSL